MEKKTKYILLGLGVVGVGVGGYYLYKHFISNNADKEDLEEILKTSEIASTLNPTANTSGSSSTTRPQLPSGFPLRKGSKGNLVKNLQKALIKKYGKAILPMYGADGGFGTETYQALLSKGLPTVIDSEAYTQLLLDSESNTESASGTHSKTNEIASLIYKAIIQNNFNLAIAGLRKIQSVREYSSVNTHFKVYRLGLVRMTLVTALLSKFDSSVQKKQLNSEFHRIGLQYNGSKWSLEGVSGINSDKLITIQSTKIWDKEGNALVIPKGTIVGEFLSGNNGVTEIETLDGKRLFIKTTDISYTP